MGEGGLRISTLCTIEKMLTIVNDPLHAVLFCLLCYFVCCAILFYAYVFSLVLLKLYLPQLSRDEP